VAARAVTAGELALLRSDGQSAQLYLSIHKPSVVYSARLASVPPTHDAVTAVAWESGVGTLANVLPGMTVYVGTAAGAYDRGMVRVRAAPTASLLPIGPTSEIAWPVGAYLTVVDEFGLWARPPIGDGAAVLIDGADYYTDQHAVPKPVALMGPDAVLWRTGATVAFQPSAAGSWVPGGTITAYLWAAPGASATSGLTTANPTITYNAAGTYRVSLRVTAANGRTTTGYRTVFVHDAANPPITQFQLGRCSGDYDRGGWRFDVTLFAEATGAFVRDRALCLLHSRDRYGAAQSSIGPFAGYENVIAAGWIMGESIDWRPGASAVTFSVGGPAEVLGELAVKPLLLQYAPVATGWEQMPGLTVDRAVHHLIHYRTTIAERIDVTPSGDTRMAQSLGVKDEDAWGQLEHLAEPILARPCCDRYGRLYVQIEQQMLADAERAAIPEVMELTTADWHDTVEIERMPLGEVASLQVSGVVWDGVAETPLLARASGTVYSRAGDVDNYDQLLLADQAQANALAARLYAQANNPYPRVGVSLAANNRMIDVAPCQWVRMSLTDTATPRGIAWSGLVLIPRQVSYRHDLKSGALTAEVELEALTQGGLAVAEQIPQPPIDNIPDQPGSPDGGGLPDFPLFPPLPGPGGLPGLPPPLIPPPPDVPSLTCQQDLGFGGNGPFTVWMLATIRSDAPNRVTRGYRCWLRGADASSPSRYTINGTWYERTPGGAWTPTSDDNWYQIYALSRADGSRIATGIKDPVTNPRQRTGTFNLPTGAEIKGIEIELTRDASTVESASIYSAGINWAGATTVETSLTGGIGPYEAEYLLTMSAADGGVGTATQVLDLGMNIHCPMGSYVRVLTSAGLQVNAGGISNRRTLYFGVDGAAEPPSFPGDSLWVSDYTFKSWLGSNARFTVRAHADIQGIDNFVQTYNAYLRVRVLNQAAHKLELRNVLLWNICGTAIPWGGSYDPT
jgi:PKD repeat protein